ncbi:chaplin [Streptomyces sp. NPDC005245]|uniref:chaplin n=1 Tax=Streptomyces sp. NPDC005245 TaxID=3157029 RepID=UPI0033A0AFE8
MPVHVPVNVCGNTVNVVGALNPAGDLRRGHPVCASHLGERASGFRKVPGAFSASPRAVMKRIAQQGGSWDCPAVPPCAPVPWVRQHSCDLRS